MIFIIMFQYIRTTNVGDTATLLTPNFGKLHWAQTMCHYTILVSVFTN